MLAKTVRSARLRAGAALLLLLSFLGATVVARAAPTIVVDPGALFGYIPLEAFGIEPIAGAEDDGLVNFDVPAFEYAGETWTRIGVASNGFLIVGGGTSGAGTNQDLPDSTAPNNVLAPFWTDLDPSAGGGIRVTLLTDGANTWIVIDWNGIGEATDGTVTNFEVWIGINGTEDITFAYDPRTPIGNGDGGLLTIGAEDKTGTVGDVVYYNSIGALPSGDLRVTTRDLPVLVPEPASLLLLGLALPALVFARRKRAATT